jgi:hypothetical protein
MLRRDKQSMDPELVDRIYESSFVPELWPGVLDELEKLVEGSGGSLYISKADVEYWTASPGAITGREEACKKVFSDADSISPVCLLHVMLGF